MRISPIQHLERIPREKIRVYLSKHPEGQACWIELQRTLSAWWRTHQQELFGFVDTDGSGELAWRNVQLNVTTSSETPGCQDPKGWNPVYQEGWQV